MDLDKYLSENFDEILDNPDEFVCLNNINNSNSNNNKISISGKKISGKKISGKKVSINELDNDIIQIENIHNLRRKNIGDIEDYDDLDEKEYMEYNSEFFDNSNDYYDIDCEDTNDDDCEDINDNDNDNDNDCDDDVNSNNNNYNMEDNQNEDDGKDDIIDELYEKMHESMQQQKTNPKELFTNQSEYQAKSESKLESKFKLESNQSEFEFDNLELIEKDDGYYFFILMNVFMKYYNNKYDKIEHFFSNINNSEKDTTNQMELFFDAIIEHKMMCEQMDLTSDEAMKQLYTESEPEKISSMFEKWNKQIYMFELDELKLFTPSLIVCLNYIFEKNILNSNWNIYNLRDN
jgi:hypothetical protein